MSETRGAGPTDAEIDAAVEWLWGFDPDRFDYIIGDYQCAIAAVAEWYFRNKDVVAALDRYEQAVIANREATAALKDWPGYGQQEQVAERNKTYEDQYRALDTILDALVLRRMDDARRRGKTGG